MDLASRQKVREAEQRIIEKMKSLRLGNDDVEDFLQRVADSKSKFAKEAKELLEGS
jgi:hypothetical protein